ncbi:MAG: glycoside hydrolase family 5 protein [Altibacter sp.]|uniref:glycoside hydrolase family 5 protein n=1 Tax=Altibacter sp. TaxID=2024823 RepID=UPI001D5D20DB|nr:cellulase family glycosylhydrolase [Altibacter sp.]MBZ0326169.1 glycoside hydrolase family 5 protein [Altibacter sp.]
MKYKTFQTIILISSIFLSIGGCVTSKPSAENNTNYTISPPVSNNKMVHVNGTKIVDGNGNHIKLKAVLLEGWLMWNGTLWGAGLTSETKITQRLEKMAGKEQTELFRTAIYDHFITEKDIEMIAEIGLNTVRVPFNHTILEDKNPLEDYSARGWKYLDNLMTWCERYNIYVVLDFHSLPGGQGAFVSDPEFINVWHSEEHQQRTVDIWKAIANRYKDRQIVAGYDLINEPDAPTGKNLVDLQKRIISEIRKVDKLHMIILEGGNFSSDFSMYDSPLDGNQVYGFHTYNFFTDETDVKNLEKLSELAKKQNVPLWNGEFGAHKLSWIEDQLELYENPKFPINGWTFWPWKRVSENSNRYRNLAKIIPGDDWKEVAKGISDLFGPSNKITPEFTKKAMDSFIEAVKAENIVYDTEVKDLLKKY